MKWNAVPLLLLWLTCHTAAQITTPGIQVVAAYPDTVAAGQTPREFHVIFIPRSDIAAATTISVTSNSVPSGYGAFINKPRAVATTGLVQFYVGDGTVLNALYPRASTCTASTVTVTTPGQVDITGCALTATELVHMVITFTLLKPNPIFVTSMFTNVVAGVISGSVDVPYTITAPQNHLQSLQFLQLQPSSSINNAALTSLTVGFVPGRALHAGNRVTLWLESSSLLASAPVTTPTISIGGCTASSVAISNGGWGLPPVAGQPGAGQVATFTLGPAGCELPEAVPVTYVLMAPYLATNPAATPAAQIAAGGVGSSMATDVEPVPVYMQFPHDYTTGAQTISAFTSAVPTTTVAGVRPDSLTVRFTLRTAIVLGDLVSISSIKGVFLSEVTTVQLSFLAPAGCGVINGFTDKASNLVFSTTQACETAIAAAGLQLAISVPSNALGPNPPAGTLTVWDVVTGKDTASLVPWTAGYRTTAATLDPTAWSNTDVYSTSFRNPVLVNWMILMSPYTPGIYPSGNTTYYKVPQASWPQSPGSYPNLVITNWGQMWTVPMLAIVTTYPLTSAALTSLLVPTTVCGNNPLVFLFSVDRFTSSGLAWNIGNPIDFNILSVATLSDVRLVTTGSTAGTSLERGWAQASNGNVYVHSPSSGVFVGCGVSGPTGSSNDSDDAWLGFLAFLIIPVCCCIACCIAAALFLKKRLRKPKCQQQCCPMEQCCPMGPESMLPMAACAPTPIFGMEGQPIAFYG